MLDSRLAHIEFTENQVKLVQILITRRQIRHMARQKNREKERARATEKEKEHKTSISEKFVKCRILVF